MPTGGGKSAIYQIAGFSLNGPTLVVSALLALQRGQVDAMRDREIGGARLLNSRFSRLEREALLRGLKRANSVFCCWRPNNSAIIYVWPRSATEENASKLVRRAVEYHGQQQIFALNFFLSIS